jgi:hypothetical protein
VVASFQPIPTPPGHVLDGLYGWGSGLQVQEPSAGPALLLEMGSVGHSPPGMKGTASSLVPRAQLLLLWHHDSAVYLYLLEPDTM